MKTKIVQHELHDWDLKEQATLCAYRTIYKVTTNMTPFKLVYGVETMIPIEFMIPSLCIGVEHNMDYNGTLRKRLEFFLTLEETRQRAK